MHRSLRSVAAYCAPKSPALSAIPFIHPPDHALLATFISFSHHAARTSSDSLPQAGPVGVVADRYSIYLTLRGVFQSRPGPGPSPESLVPILAPFLSVSSLCLLLAAAAESE